MLKPPIRVAVVDDDASVRTALARLLRTLSFAAETFGSAREFIDSLDGGLPQCLVLDLHMADMSGLDLQQYLAREGIRIPAVIVTGHDDSEARERCQSAGAVAYLLKPLNDAALISAICSAIGHPSLARSAP